MKIFLKKSGTFSRFFCFRVMRGFFLLLTMTTEYPFMRHIPCVGVVSPKPG